MEKADQGSFCNDLKLSSTYDRFFACKILDREVCAGCVKGKRKLRYCGTGLNQKSIGHLCEWWSNCRIRNRSKWGCLLYKEWNDDSVWCIFVEKGGWYVSLSGRKGRSLSAKIRRNCRIWEFFSCNGCCSGCWK